MPSSISTMTSSRLLAAVVLLFGLLIGCDANTQNSPSESPDPEPQEISDENPSPPDPAQEDRSDLSSDEEDRPDLSSDEGLAEAYESQTGRELGDRGCIVRPEAFDHVVVVSGFAYDYGCMHRGLFVDGEWIRGLEAATPRALTAMGWAEMSDDERQDLAATWVEEVVHSLSTSPITRSTETFELEDTPTFEPIETTTDADGTTIVTLWIRMPPGMIREYSYRKYEYRFDDEANLDSERIERFSVSFDERH